MLWWETPAKPSLHKTHTPGNTADYNLLFFYGNDSGSDYSMNNKKENLNVIKGRRRGGASILGVYRDWCLQVDLQVQVMSHERWASRDRLLTLTKRGRQKFNGCGATPPDVGHLSAAHRRHFICRPSRPGLEDIRRCYLGPNSYVLWWHMGGSSSMGVMMTVELHLSKFFLNLFII